MYLGNGCNLLSDSRQPVSANAFVQAMHRGTVPINYENTLK